MTENHRLATYGTLAPGRPNHHHLDGLRGRWFEGHVHGTLVDAGWGAALGFPALILDPDAPVIDVHVFESADLPAHWAHLVEFEGPGYERIPATIHTPRASARHTSTPCGQPIGHSDAEPGGPTG